jgi:hypothetical protein
MNYSITRLADTPTGKAEIMVYDTEYDQHTFIIGDNFSDCLDRFVWCMDDGELDWEDGRA